MKKQTSPADDAAALRLAQRKATMEELKLIHKSAQNMSIVIARLDVADVLGRVIRLLEGK